MEIVHVITILVIAIVLFLIFREIVCWYWKINQFVKLLEEIRDLLRSLPGQLSLDDNLSSKTEPQFPEQDSNGRYIIPEP